MWAAANLYADIKYDLETWQFSVIRKPESIVSLPGSMNRKALKTNVCTKSQIRIKQTHNVKIYIKWNIARNEKIVSNNCIKLYWELTLFIYSTIFIFKLAKIIDESARKRHHVESIASLKWIKNVAKIMLMLKWRRRKKKSMQKIMTERSEWKKNGYSLFWSFLEQKV